MGVIVANYSTTSQIISKERCPECAKRGRDTSKDNLAVYSDGHAFCYSCHYFRSGDRIKTIKNHLAEVQPLDEIVVLPEDVTTIPNDEALTWFYSFGFDFTDLIHNKILWSNNYARLIFPIYDAQSNLLAWQGRYFGNEQRPKWLSKGKIHELVYVRGSGDTVYLVEDIVSCLKLEKAGLSSGCLFGSNPSVATLNRFKLVANKLVFWLDDDKKIESVKFRRLAETLGIPCGNLFTTNDPKDYSIRQIRELTS